MTSDKISKVLDFGVRKYFGFCDSRGFCYVLFTMLFMFLLWPTWGHEISGDKQTRVVELTYSLVVLFPLLEEGIKFSKRYHCAAASPWWGSTETLSPFRALLLCEDGDSCRRLFRNLQRFEIQGRQYCSYSTTTWLHGRSSLGPYSCCRQVEILPLAPADLARLS